MLAHFVLLSVLTLGDTTTAVPAKLDRPRVEIDTTATEIRITVRGLRIPAEVEYAHAAEERFDVTWPASGWMRGYRIDVLDSSGYALPPGSMHHAGIVNLDRRRLAYEAPELLVAAGRETEPFRLPGKLGVPVSTGQHLVAYFMLVNVTGMDVEDAAVRFTFPWTSAGTSERLTDVFPIYLNANAGKDGVSFDVLPGRSETSSEFVLPVGGRMRAVGGHMHDFAEEIRLEEVATGRVLVRLGAEKGADGSLQKMPIAKFLTTRGGLRLEADRHYRVVAVYNNPGCETIKAGAMALLAGPFAPDDVRRWPAIDSAHPFYSKPASSDHESAAMSHEGHGGHGTHLPACTTRGSERRRAT